MPFMSGILLHPPMKNYSLRQIVNREGWEALIDRSLEDEKIRKWENANCKGGKAWKLESKNQK